MNHGEAFLPTSRAEMDARGWDEPDISSGAIAGFTIAPFDLMGP